MSLTDILKERSDWTYKIMQASANLGEMIREDAITSVNLAVINDQVTAERINLGTTSTQGARLEAELGTDWVWSYGNNVLFIQAKRLDPIAQVRNWAYSIDTGQLRHLLQASALYTTSTNPVTPCYVLYNSLINKDSERENYGMMITSAEGIYNYLDGSNRTNQRSAIISFQEMLQLNTIPVWQFFQNMDQSSSASISSSFASSSTATRSSFNTGW